MVSPSSTETPHLEVHGYLTCPFVWRVRLTAAEKGLDVDWIPCDVETPDPRAAAHNPDEHSPLLYEPGVGTLFESEVIMQYLDEGFAGRPLMPAGAHQRAELRLAATRLQTIDVHTEPSRPAARRKAAPALRLLEEALEGRPHLHGEEPGLTDLLVVPFVAHLAARGLLAAADLPRTTRYLEQVSQRPSFQATRPPWARSIR